MCINKMSFGRWYLHKKAEQIREYWFLWAIVIHVLIISPVIGVFIIPDGWTNHMSFEGILINKAVLGMDLIGVGGVVSVVVFICFCISVKRWCSNLAKEYDSYKKSGEG